MRGSCTMAAALWCWNLATLAASSAALAQDAPPPVEHGTTLATPTSATSAASTPPTPAATTTLSGQVELARLVDLAAQRRGVRVEYDPALLRGTTTLRADVPLSDDELWSLMHHVLALRGFTTVKPAGSEVLSVVKLMDAAGVVGVRLSDAPPSLPASSAGYMSEVIRLQRRQPRDVLDGVKAVLSKPAGTVTALADSPMIVVSDLAPRIAEARRLVAILDVDVAPAPIEKIEVKNVPAAQLVTAVMQVAAKRDTVMGSGNAGAPGSPAAARTPGEVFVAPSGNAILLVAPPATAASWRELIAQLDQRQPVTTKTYSPKRFAVKEVVPLIEQTAKDPAYADERWRVVTDELTSSLIVTGTAAQHEKVAELVARLDEQQPDAASRPVRSFPVRNRPVAELLASLNNLIEAGVLDAQATGSSNESSRAAVRAAGDQRSEKPLPANLGGPGASGSSSSTTPSNSSSTRGPRSSRSNDASGLRESTSTRGDRVDSGLSLTADEGTNTIIAIGEPRLLSQLESLIKQLDVRQPQVMLEVLMVSLNDADSVTLGIELDRITTIAGSSLRLSSVFGLSQGAQGTAPVGASTGFTGAVLNPGEFGSVIRALETVNKGRSSSMPRLLVNNNEQATFSSTVQQPYATLSTPGLSNNTTTTFGGTEDAGTTISLRPQIAQGDHLVLQYSISLSSFLGSSGSSNLPPPKQQNRVDSVATIPDGHTVVVGGIEVLTDGKSASQVPLLGDIPVLGNLFKSQGNQLSRARFYVFIRASVLRSNGFEDLKYMSEVERANAGVEDGFPEVEPRVIR